MFAASHLTLSEHCQQVVLLTPADAVSAAYAVAVATSPLVPQNARVVVWDMPRAAPGELKDKCDTRANAPGNATKSTDSSAANGTFAHTLKQIETRMLAHRTPRPYASVTYMTQVFYGGVSPKRQEIAPMLQRIEVREGLRASATAALGASGVSVENSVFLLMLNAQCLGDDTDVALKPYEAFLRSIWKPEPVLTSAKRAQGSLIIVADDVYRVEACTMLKAVAAEVATNVDWTVLLAYAHAMDPPALEFGSAEVVVEGATGIAQGGTLPVLCAANALGVLRHFPVSRSEPATVTPADVALNAAMLGFIFLRHDALPECSEIWSELQHVPAPSAAFSSASLTSATVEEKSDEAASKTAAAATPLPSTPTRHHVASFAVAQSYKPAEASLVWGMFGEYLMSYYGRFAEFIRAGFPVTDVLESSPILQFPFSVTDIVNFGPEPRCPTYPLEAWRAYQRRQRVTTDFHGAVVTRRMRACVAQLDDTVKHIQRVARAAAAEGKAQAARPTRQRAFAATSFALAPYQLEDFNVHVYQQMLRRLTMNYALMPYHQCVALSEVDWEAYISTIARSVLVHLAHTVTHPTRGTTEGTIDRSGGAASAQSGPLYIAGLAGVKAPETATPTSSESSGGPTAEAKEVPAPAPESFQFPEPRRTFTDDLVYHGEDRIPPFPSLVRHYFTCATFLHRVALCSNGWRSNMSPGLTNAVLTGILAQPPIQRLMTAMAAKDGVTKAEVEAQGRKILLQTGDTLNHPQCRTMGLMVREVFKRIYGRVNINLGAFERLHRQLAMPRVTLVFVPLHRSYVDFLILSFVLAAMQSPMPHVVAGDNFLSMGPIATLMRGSGAFFMRRSFRGDPLYAALFKEYVRQMVLARRPLEFFMEGTRSRTGKTMAPKMGILKFICDVFFDPNQRELDDVLFVPVSLSYDELLEATVYAKELLGVPKPPETLSNLLKSSGTLKRMHGNINIHMGDALSLRSLKAHPHQCPLPYQPKTLATPAVTLPANQKIAPSPANSNNNSSGTIGISKAVRNGEQLDTTPVVATAASPTPPSLLSTVAWHLTYELQRNIVITPASMAAALLECLSPYYNASSFTSSPSADTPAAAEAPSPASTPAAELKGKRAEEEVGVPVVQMEQGVEWLRAILLDRGARLSLEAATWTASRVVVAALHNLQRFAHLSSDMAHITYHPDSLVTRLGVNISTNQLIHVCIDEALVVVVAQAFGTMTKSYQRPSANGLMESGERTVRADVLANQTQLLQHLLSTEFPNFSAGSPVSFSSWLQCTVSQLQHHQRRLMELDAAKASSASSSPLSPSAVAAATASGASTSQPYGERIQIPVNQYYYFLLQLICPHLEALYVVLLTALTLLRAYSGQPLCAADVVSTTQRACHSLYDERVLHYAVTANKETLQHYFESLIALSIFQLGRLPPAAAAAGAKAKANAGTVVYKTGLLGQKKATERLEVLASQIYPLMWHAEAAAGSRIDAKAVTQRVLKAYQEITQPSRM